jgi:hypothetical protein
LLRYHEFISEYMANGGQPPTTVEQITVNELIARFWIHVEQYYRGPDGTATSEVENFRQAIRPIKELYGPKKVCEFGPRALVGN